jgi:hypothetical protein
MNKTLLQQAITDLWHTSRTALAGQSLNPSRYDRMQYVKRELNRTYPQLIDGMTGKAVWFAIDDQLNY